MGHVLGMEMDDYISKEKEKGNKITRNGSTTKPLPAKTGRFDVLLK